MIWDWLWLIPSLLSVGVFGVIMVNAWFDRRAAATDGERIIATERILTSAGLWSMGGLAAVAGVVAITSARTVVTHDIVLACLVAVPWAHLLIGMNILVGRNRARGPVMEEEDGDEVENG